MKEELENKQQKRRKRIGKLKKIALIVGAIVCFVLGGIIGFEVRDFIAGKEAVSESRPVKLGFEEIGELATQAAYCTEINVTDASRELFGLKIPFTQSKYIYSYDVVVKAGIDFREVAYTVDDTAQTVTVTLPKFQILGSELIKDSFKVYHEEESIFRRITLEETNDALEKLKETAEKNAKENGLLENARSNAEMILTSFFRNHELYGTYEIIFTDKK